SPARSLRLAASTVPSIALLLLTRRRTLSSLPGPVSFGVDHHTIVMANEFGGEFALMQFSRDKIPITLPRIAITASSAGNMAKHIAPLNLAGNMGRKDLFLGSPWVKYVP